MTTYTIENANIKVSASTKGAELTSLILKETGVEYLWQGNPTYWKGQAPNLFPICGRLWEGKYTYDGMSYEMNLHGFARNAEYELVKKTDTSMTFRLSDTEESYGMYPFHFQLFLTYTLEGASVKTTFCVENRDEKELIYAVGGHPGFNVPLSDGESFEDYTISFSEKCTPKQLCLSERGHFLKDTKAFPLHGDRFLPLSHTLFDNDAIFLTDMAHEVMLQSGVSGHFVKLSYPEMPFVGFWHAPKTTAPYLCIEPWTSVPADDGKIDELSTKRFMTHLAVGQTKEHSFTISIG